MKKSEQIKINERVIAEYELLKNDRSMYKLGEHRLRSCQATVICGGYGHWLKSYNTIVAFIPYYNNTCYDFLRYVYGYTATSAKHIAKFARDYGNGEILSWKEV